MTVSRGMTAVVLVVVTGLTAALDEWTLRTMMVKSKAELDALDAKYEADRAAEMAHYRNLRKLMTGDPNGDSSPLLALPKYGRPGFYHGVASGSPTTSSVVLWTRYTPWSEDDEVSIEFRIAKVDAGLEPVEAHLDPSANGALRRGVVTATHAHDWVAKIDVQGLEAGAQYVYAFQVVGTDISSEVGVTKTVPASGDEPLRVAVFSCSDFTYGYFHAYDIASRVTDLDMWIHTGDYLYEYGNWYDRPSPERNAALEPKWEQVSLNDYRLRFALHHDDEGLRHLRKAAPMGPTSWDDHESTNNPYAWNGVDGTGAQNHQPECAVDYTATDAEKRSATCDRDEGDWRVRVQDAAQAYFEWMPIRSGAYFDGMGMIQGYDMTQIVEWGDLATLFAIDTRHTIRSREPTLDSSFSTEFNFAFDTANFGDMDAYTTPGTAAYNETQAATARAAAEADDPTMVLVSDGQFALMEETFAASKAAGKPWQVFTSSVMMAPHVGPDPRDAAHLPEAAGYEASITEFWDDFLPTDAAGAWRRIAAMKSTNTSWNRDGWAGFGVQRAEFTDLCKAHAANCVVLSGDVHDHWAFQVYDQGTYEAGEPVAVNLVAGGVTRNGWGGFVEGFYDAATGHAGIATTYDIMEASFRDANPGLVYAGMKDPGFFVMELNASHLVTEYVWANPYGKDSDIPKAIVNLYPYALARSVGDTDGLTMAFYCDTSLVTTAGHPGSLADKGTCQIPFDDARPALWDLPVPAAIQCATDADCPDTWQCDLPTPLTCDGVFNCPDTAADDAGRRLARSARKLRFAAYTDAGEDGHDMPSWGVSTGSLGACVPM